MATLLPWWGWLLCGVSIYAVGSLLHEGFDSSIARWVIGWIIRLLGLAAAFVGLWQAGTGVGY